MKSMANAKSGVCVMGIGYAHLSYIMHYNF